MRAPRATFTRSVEHRRGQGSGYAHTRSVLGGVWFLALSCSSEAPSQPSVDMAGITTGAVMATTSSATATTGGPTVDGTQSTAVVGSTTSVGATTGAAASTSGSVTTGAATTSGVSGAGGATNDSAISTATSTTASAQTGVTSTSAGGSSSQTTTTASGDTTGGASTGTTGGTGTDCEGGKVVHFVYFVEADASYSESQHADIEAMAYAFQQYWFEQLGVTFYLNEPIVDVIEADHDSAWYIETPDGIHSDQRWYRLGNIKNEVYAKLGIENFDANHRVVNYPTTRSDGRVGGNFGGAWMDGDDLTCMAEPNGVNYPYGDGADAHCMGHVAHEFGHVLSLDHQGPQTDCMQYGFYNNSGGSGMCDFSPENVAQILAASINDGWFEAQPGENCVGL